MFDAIGIGHIRCFGPHASAWKPVLLDNIFLTTFLGTTTAIGGGMLRDVLLQEMPFVLKKRVYGRCRHCRRTGLCAADENGRERRMAYALGMMATIAVRILATVFRWNLPKAI